MAAVSDESRVIVHAPTGRDASLACAILTREGIGATHAHTWRELCTSIESGAGALLLAQEGLLPECVAQLTVLLAAQPAWSDLPLLVFTRGQDDPQPLLEQIGGLAPVVFIERPARIKTLISVVRSALRSRQRQYETRDLLQRLNDNDRRKNEFLAMLGHELRNPLAAIRTALPVLERRAEGDIVRPLAVLERQASNLSRIVDDLLEVSRVVLGKIALRPRTVDLREIAQAAAHSLRNKLEENAQTLALDLCAEPLLTRADPVRIEQVVVNLLHNASKYTPPRGALSLAVKREEGEAVIVVSDDGVGMPTDILETVFEPFMQADTSLHRSQGGLGLGLPLVKTLVSLHNGTIRATSNGPGLGSTFTVRLPLADPHAALEPDSDPPAPDPEPANCARVLIVDDNQDFRDMVELLLEALGHEVQTASDGFQAVEKALAHPPDVALIDIGLPGLDGYEVARRIRAALPGSRVRLVAVTGYGQPEDRANAFAAGFDDQLVKPVETAALTRAVGGDGASVALPD